MRALDYAPVRKLLTRFAAKAERSGGVSCTQKLDAKSFPDVFAAASGEDADYSWALLKDAAAAAGVEVRLKPTREICAEYERSPKLVLAGANLHQLRSALGLQATEPSYREKWKTALQARLAAPPSVVEAMAAYTLKVEGRTPEELVEALNILRNLRDRSLLLREASSLTFWSLSKVLDDREEMVAKLLELDHCPFAPPALQLAVRLPVEPMTGVLFVENRTTFDSLGKRSAANVEGLALVYSAGFQASARRLTDRAYVHCFFAEDSGIGQENVELLHAFLFDQAALPCFFFGDLDYSGMGILKAMRQNFPQLRAWDPGYQRLLARLLAKDGHSAAAARKTGQRDPERTGCDLADDVLLPAMREHGLFVDQE